MFLKKNLAIYSLLLFFGCAALFGWDIHAPGVLSENFSYRIHPTKERVALYLEPSVWEAVSKNKGGWSADPQTFHIGEAYVPMIIEGFQAGFEEFIFLETEPTQSLMRHYDIPYTAVIQIKDFGNRVTMKGQAVTLSTETVVLDRNLNELGRFQSQGSSDAEKIFSKKGGPEVNLNAAIENNVMAVVQYIQDAVQTGKWR